MTAAKPEHDAKEIELKLAFAPADAPRILSHPVILASQAAPTTRELISVYYDTGEDVLRKAGVFLRVRSTGDGYVQTIKTARGEAEFLERDEWEQPTPTHEPDLGAADGTALAPLLNADVRAALGPRFQTRFRRQTYWMRCDDTEIELAIDQGEITAGVLATPISELELELKAGDKRELFHLARDLAESVPLFLAIKTKAERGFELCDGGDFSVEKAGDIVITPDMTCGDAFRAIARSCLRQIVANTPAVRGGRPEALHQMRIGLRRLRAGLSLFADVVADQDREHIKSELRWITQELGPARDLDVYAADVLEPLRATHPGAPEIAEAHRDFLDRHAAAYARATSAVGSDRFRKLLLDLAAWIEIGAWADHGTTLDAAPVDGPATRHAAKHLSKLRRTIKKKGRRLREASAPERHKLRIRAKRLRYATEFFAATFPGKKSDKRREKSLAALKELQDSLGILSDIATRALLAAGEGVPPREPGADSAEEATQLKRAVCAYERFADAKAFWKA
ncbi:MAG TPA: CHAD domain-containing protein [Methyloceanibacter sp.]|nr:CHAD domain-containing protein [Methyloceanibacter sp.]